MSDLKSHDNENYENKTDEYAKTAQDKTSEGIYDATLLFGDTKDKVNSARDALRKSHKSNSNEKHNKAKNNYNYDKTTPESNKTKNSKNNKNNSNQQGQKNNSKPSIKKNKKLQNSNNSPIKRDIDKKANPFNKSRIVKNQNNKGKKTAKKAPKKAAKATKDTIENSAKVIAESSSKAATAAALGPAGIAVLIIIIVLTIGALIMAIIIAISQNAVVTAAAQNNNKTNLTEEGKEIFSVFKSYVYTSDDSDSSSDLVTYNDIINNGYAPAVCAMWKELTMEQYITNRSKKWKVEDIVKGSYGKGYEDSGKPPTFTPNLSVKSKIDKKVKKYSNSYEAMYDYFCGQFYLRKKASHFTDKNFNPHYYSSSLYVVGKDFNYINTSKSITDENNIVNNEYHYHYCNNVIKTCLNAFIDKETGNVFESGKDFLGEYKRIQKDKKRDIKGKTKEELIEESKNYQIKKAIKNLEGEKGLLENCETKITSKKTTVRRKVQETKPNISSKPQISTEKSENQTTKPTTSKYKTKETLKYQHLSDWMYTVKNKKTKWLYDKKSHKFDKQIKKDIIETTAELTSEEGDSSKGSGSDASDVCELAKSQIGKMGKDYCLGQTKCWSGGMNQWCAIFQGWLLEQVGVKPSDVGWSASCSSWIRSATSKGLYHSRTSGYKPKAGDILFFQWGHVGLVYEVKGIHLKTIEGNTDTYNLYTSKVAMHDEYKISSASIRGYIDMSKFYSGSVGTGGLAKGTGLKPRYTDPNYKGGKYPLTKSQRKKMLYLINNENGGSWAGAVLTAQCIRDQLKRDKSETPDTIRHGGKNFEALDSYMPGRGKPEKNSYAYKALVHVFDKGGYAVKHRILYFKAVSVCNSRGTGGWHDTQLFICSIGNGKTLEKFYDSADGYKGK